VPSARVVHNYLNANEQKCRRPMFDRNLPACGTAVSQFRDKDGAAPVSALAGGKWSVPPGGDEHGVVIAPVRHGS
jgi:hypothetical protein